jgi:ABC-type enterochelin transport system permease subunit
MTVKDKLVFRKSVRTVIVEAIILFVWFSCSYKANILSLILICVLIRHALRHIFDSENYNYIKYTVCTLMLI